MSRRPGHVLWYLTLGMGTAFAQSPYVALSLREATRPGRRGDPTARSLGGITRLLGTVRDPDGDLILVGRQIPTLPAIDLELLALAMRNARFAPGEPILLSLDPDPLSATSGRLHVRTQGLIEGTRAHAALLHADVLLKIESLQQSVAFGRIASYSKRVLDARLQDPAAAAVRDWHWLSSEDSARSGARLAERVVVAEQRTHVRFWFEAAQPCWQVRDDVCVLSQLDLRVAVQSLGEQPDRPAPTEPAAEAFAENASRLLTESLAAHPAVAGIKPIFDLCALAQGLVAMQDTMDLSWLLRDMQVSPSPDARTEHPAAHLTAMLTLVDGRQEVVQLSGGVRLRTALRRLNSGNAAFLKPIVLATRPSTTALTWRLPLEGWVMPNAGTLELPPAVLPGDDMLGTSCFTQRLTLLPPGAPMPGGARRFQGFDAIPGVGPGGVSMRMGIRADAFQIDRTGQLDALRTLIEQSRPADRLTWPASQPGPGTSR